MRALLLPFAVLVSAVECVEQKFVLALRHEPEALQKLEKRLYEVSDPRHRDYGQWLSSADVASFVAPPASTVAAAKAYVTAHFANPSCASGAEIKSMAVSGQGDYLEIVVRTADRGDDAEEDECVQRVVQGRSWFKGAGGAVEGAFKMKTTTTATATAASPTMAKAKAMAGLGMETVGPPNAQKEAYGIPVNETGASPKNPQLQVVWGPGTFGYLPTDIATFYETLDVAGASPDHVRPFGYSGEVGGDNFGEATLDVSYITGLAGGVPTVVANTNDSSTAEETVGFGPALLAFSHLLANAGTDGVRGHNGLPLPSVVSMSLGSLSYDSCELLCRSLADDAASPYTFGDCTDYMATQRQVCMFPFGEEHAALPSRISAEFLKATARGVTLLAATGDGGSHFSFGAFPEADAIGRALNDASCQHALPTFPAESPFVLGVGGEQWEASPSPDGAPANGASASDPIYWYAGGSGFSRRFARPPYQDEAVAGYLTAAAAEGSLPPEDSFLAGNRAYPDVSALAWGVPMVLNGTSVTTGGTSASAPAFAGVVSLLNGRRAVAGLPPLGFLHPRLYQAMAEEGQKKKKTTTTTTTTTSEKEKEQEDTKEMFKDITFGNSSVGGDMYQCGNGFVAREGWDATTGWGSPRWEGLVEHLASDDHLLL